MPDLGAPELIIIAVVVLVLFGSKKLPEAARSLGRSLRIFKSEVKAMGDDASAPAAVTPTTPANPASTQAAAAPALTAPAATAPAVTAPAAWPASDPTPADATARPVEGAAVTDKASAAS